MAVCAIEVGAVVAAFVERSSEECCGHEEEEDAGCPPYCGDSATCVSCFRIMATGEGARIDVAAPLLTERNVSRESAEKPPTPEASEILTVPRA